MSDIQRVTKDCAVCGAPFFPRSSRAKNCPKHVKKMNKPADVASLTAGELIDQYSAYGGQAYDSTGCIPGCVSTGDAATDDADRKSVV